MLRAAGAAKGEQAKATCHVPVYVAGRRRVASQAGRASSAAPCPLPPGTVTVGERAARSGAPGSPRSGSSGKGAVRQRGAACPSGWWRGQGQASSMLRHATVRWPPAPMQIQPGGSGRRGTLGYFVVSGVLALGCVPTVWGCAMAAFDYEPIAAGRFGSSRFLSRSEGADAALTNCGDQTPMAHFVLEASLFCGNSFPEATGLFGDGLLTKVGWLFSLD